MYFRTLHRATLAQAPERTDYEAGDEVIVETTYDSETYRSSLRIVGPAVPKAQTPSPEVFVRTRTSDETDGAIDLPALRAAIGTIKAHAGLINACFKNHNLSRLAGTLSADNPAEKMVSTLWFIVEDEWRPQNEPKRRSP